MAGTGPLVDEYALGTNRLKEFIYAGKWGVGFYSWGGSKGRIFQEERMRRGNIQMWEGKTRC